MSSDGDDDGATGGLPESLGALVVKYGGQVKSFIRRRIRVADHQSTEDLAQEVYLRLLRWPPKEFVKNPAAYLFQVAANVVTDYAVKNSREPAKFDSELVETYTRIAEESSGDQLRTPSETEQFLAWVVKPLPPLMAAVLVLCKRDGYSYREAGERLGISHHLVKKYLFEAVARCSDRAKKC
jgi:RNA polymerase sigma factor (sigma-70 family)